MSQMNFYRWAVAVVWAWCGSSCTLLKDNRFADGEEAAKGPGSELLAPTTVDGSKRVMDIRSTFPRQWPGMLATSTEVGGLAGTPPPTLTGAENFEALPLAANGLFPGDANPDAPAWQPVPASPLRLNPGSASWRRLPPDFDTVQAVVNALPAVTGASLARPYVLANLTASTAPAMAAAFSGAAVESTPSPAASASSVAPAPAAPVTSPPPPLPSRDVGEPVLPQSRVSRLLTSEHEAE
jgi:hypothetical protein